MTEQIVLAFDIERSGATPSYDTIAIGASVVDSDFVELDSFSANGYIPGETQFEQRCYDEFWSKHDDVLSTLRYDGTLDKFGREKQMIEDFQEFRRSWDNCQLVADNNVYDGGFINVMINDHTDDMPLPYSALTGEYKAFFETHSQQRGLLMMADPSYKKKWGFSKRIAEIWNVPHTDRVHTHCPADDAYVIAYDQQVLFGIASGKITRK